MDPDRLKKLVARWIAEGPVSDLTDDDEFLGTPYFVPPEVLIANGFTVERLIAAAKDAERERNSASSDETTQSLLSYDDS